MPRTPTGEVERILAAADQHFRKYLADEPAGKLGLMAYAMRPMMRNPEIAEQTIRQWEDARRTGLNGVPDYLTCMHLVCACCAVADRLHHAGQKDEAWASVIDAQLVSGIALAHYVSRIEVKHANSTKGKKGGTSKKSNLTKKFACELFDKEGFSSTREAVDRLWPKVEEHARLQGWKMTLTRGPRTLQKWLNDHVTSRVNK
jgi:hypothetical protein